MNVNLVSILPIDWEIIGISLQSIWFAFNLNQIKGICKYLQENFRNRKHLGSIRTNL